MNNETPINVDGSPDLMGKAGQLLHAMRERAGKAVCLLDARMRTLTVEPEEGAATAEYAVVLVAATWTRKISCCLCCFFGGCHWLPRRMKHQERPYNRTLLHPD